MIQFVGTMMQICVQKHYMSRVNLILILRDIQNSDIFSEVTGLFFTDPPPRLLEMEYMLWFFC